MTFTNSICPPGPKASTLGLNDGGMTCLRNLKWAALQRLFGWFNGQVAYWTALWLGVVILALLGWIAFGSRGAPWYWRLCGAFATACFGLLVILLKILVS